MTTWFKQLDTWPKQIVALVCIWFVTLVGLVSKNGMMSPDIFSF